MKLVNPCKNPIPLHEALGTLAQGDPTMKIESENLESDKPVSECIKKTKNVTYDHKKAHIERPEDQDVYPYQSIRYVENYGFTIVPTLKKALVERANGKKSMTIREADICARGQISLDSEFLKSFMFSEFGLFLSESDSYFKDNAWNLRVSYNKGLQWKGSKRLKESEEMIEKGDAKIERVVNELKEMGLPLWPKELIYGVPAELTKPEWMTWEQYAKSKKNQKEKGLFDDV